MSIFTQPLKFVYQLFDDGVYASTNGIKDYEVAQSDCPNIVVARTTDEEFFEYCRDFDDAFFLCNQHHEQLVQDSLAEKTKSNEQF